jgi:hypothetical protein
VAARRIGAPNGERIVGDAARRPTRKTWMKEGSITMARGIVVLHFSRFGKPL